MLVPLVKVDQGSALGRDLGLKLDFIDFGKVASAPMGECVLGIGREDSRIDSRFEPRNEVLMGAYDLPFMKTRSSTSASLSISGAWLSTALENQCLALMVAL